MVKNYKFKWPSNSAIFIGILLISFIIFLVWYQLEEFQLQNDPKLKELKTIIEPLFINNNKYNGLLSNINDDNIMEKVSIYKGHTQKFEDTFKQLLDEAVKEGVYDPEKPIISDYCDY